MIEEVVAERELDLPLNASFGLAVAQLRSVSVIDVRGISPR